MESNAFMRVDDVAAELGISKSYAYKIVQRMNAELRNMGYLTIAGRVSRKYFMEKVCYDENERRDVRQMAVYKDAKTNTWRVQGNSIYFLRL